MIAYLLWSSLERGEKIFFLALTFFVTNTFFFVEERSDRASKAGGPVQADRTNIFFGGKVNVGRCQEFRSNSKNKFCRCEDFQS